MIYVTSVDAGGAEILSDWLLLQDFIPTAILDGPAKKIFRTKSINYLPINYSNNFNKNDTLYASLSWSSNLEKQTLKKAIQSCMKTVILLDHWINFRDRFVLNGELLFPTEIWIFDEFHQNYVLVLKTLIFFFHLSMGSRVIL